MNFFRTSLFASLSTGVTMLCGLVTTKYVALAVGPTGMAFTGQFVNATSILTLLGTAACTSGVVKYIAQYSESEDKRRLFSSAISLICLCSIVVSLIAMAFSKSLSQRAFNTDIYWKVFVIYGFLLIFSSFNQLSISTLNGDAQIKRMTILNVFNSVVNLISVVAMAHFFGLEGVLLASSVTAFVSFWIYLTQIRKLPWIGNVDFSLLKPDKSQIKLLLGFTAMNITSGLLAPALQLVVRTRLITEVDAGGAGLWQANTRLSDFYLNFIYTVMGVYYLPKLSQLKETTEIRREIRLGFARILPAVGAVTLTIYFCKEWIVKLFLTDDFMPMLPLIKWQLIGDFIKIASWLLAYLMVARAMKKAFISTEIIFSTLYVILSVVSVHYFGIVGPVYAFVANYTLYFITMLILMRKYII